MGGQGSGGAHGGPQYSPMNVSATGGNGQSGTQAAKYIPGMAYGQGQETMNQQKSAPMAAQPKPSAAGVSASMLGEIVPLTAPTMRPDEPATAGAAAGKGPGMEALNLPKQETGDDPDIDLIRAYYPAMQYWANQVGTPQTTKDYIRYLGTII